MADRRYCWGEFPQKLLRQVFDCIKDPMDICSCRLVCKSWLIASQVYFPLCLIQRDGEDGDSRTLFNFSTRETRKIHLPEIKRQYICCYSNGWLLTVDHASPHRLRLLSLTSKTQILLPSGKTLCHDDPLSALARAGNFVKKTIVSTCPQTSNLVVLIQYGQFRVAFCKKGDRKWKCFNRVEHLLDIILYKDQFYGVDFWGKILLLQLKPKAKEVDLNMFGYPGFMNKYLVESVDGELCMVSSNCRVGGDSREPFPERLSFQVFRLSRRKAWVELEVKDMRGQALIICGGLCVSVPTGGHGRKASIIRGNCILFDRILQGNHLLMMHDLETKQTEMLYQSSGNKLLPIFNALFNL